MGVLANTGGGKKVARSTRVSDESKARFLNLRDQGVTKSTAARQIGVSVSWAQGFEAAMEADPMEARRLRAFTASNVTITGPKEPHQLDDLALRCLDDFELFRVTVFGRRCKPWASDAAQRVADLFDTDDREFVVMNCAPGSGKTALFTCDIPSWLTVRSRSIRGALGHAVQTKATQYTGRLRREFERTKPLRATAEAKEKRGQLDAVATMAQLYGRFKSPNPDIWRRETFTVEQIGSVESGEKEATWNWVSLDAEFIGDRLDFLCFDDAVTTRRARSEDVRNADREKWDREIESRVEPGGLLLLVGQRLNTADLYRYNLDKTVEIDADHGPDEPALVAKYHHIVYRAHDTDRCKDDHGRDAKPWHPDETKSGCLVDPVAIPWHGKEGLAAKQKLDPRDYALVYQQDDSAGSDKLVQRLWVDGGRDAETGEIFNGCWDDGRDPAVIPALHGRVLSYCVVDPSAANYWAVSWTLYEVETERRYLIDLLRQRMTAGELLEQKPYTSEFVGIMEDWQRRSEKLGKRITHWVIEQNSQQRYILQYAFFKTWRERNRVRIIGHETHNKNRADRDMGVEGLLPNVWRNGLIRLPGTQTGRLMSRPLVSEVTAWPDGVTNDCAMNQWMGEFNLPTILAATEEPKEQYEWRPSWMGGGEAEPGMAERALARLAGVS